MDLNEIAVFTRVVQAGSFTAASKALGMPKSTVSRKVSDLEDRLGARLLHRTTRKLSLTDVGRTYFEYGSRIVNDLEAAESAVKSQQQKPRGLLRMTTFEGAGWLGPIIADYMKRCPDVQLEVFSTGRVVDLVHERFDLAIRAGALADSSLISRSLGSVRWCLVAAPSYLKKKPRPVAPEELRDHACLFFSMGSMDVDLQLTKGAQTVQLRLPAKLLVSGMEILYSVTREGIGIGLLPEYVCADDLRARRLVPILADWSPPETPTHVLYPSARYLSASARSFIEFLQAQLTPWSGRER